MELWNRRTAEPWNHRTTKNSASRGTAEPWNGGLVTAEITDSLNYGNVVLYTMASCHCTGSNAAPRPGGTAAQRQAGHRGTGGGSLATAQRSCNRKTAYRYAARRHKGITALQQCGYWAARRPTSRGTATCKHCYALHCSLIEP